VKETKEIHSKSVMTWWWYIHNRSITRFV